MERVLDAFRRCASQLSSAAALSLQIDVKDFPLIDRQTWNSLRFNSAAQKRLYFRLSCRAREQSAEYTFFFSHHFHDASDPANLRRSPPLLVSEWAEGDADFVLLARLATEEQRQRPILLREILTQEQEFYSKEWNSATDAWKWIVETDAVPIAMRFFEQVLKYRLNP